MRGQTGGRLGPVPDNVIVVAEEELLLPFGVVQDDANAGDKVRKLPRGRVECVVAALVAAVAVPGRCKGGMIGGEI